MRGHAAQARATRGRAALLMCVVIAALQVVPMTSASAYVSCTNYYPTGNYFDGYYVRPPVAAEGTRATINYEFGNLCDSVNNGSSTYSNNFHYTWVMLENGNATGGLAQIGYFRPIGGTPRLAAEYDVDASYSGADFVRTFGTAVGTSANATFWVYYNPSTGHLDLNYDNHQLSSTPFNPNSKWGSPSNWYSEWFGEVTQKASDMPGTSSARTNFRSMNVQRWDNDQYTSSIGSPTLRNDKSSPAANLSGSSYWARTYIYSNGFDIFTVNPQS